MKKINFFFFALIFTIMCLGCSAENKTLENGKISLSFDIKEKCVSLADIKSKNKSFMSNTSHCNIWSFTAKKNKDYTGEEIILTENNAENVTSEFKKNSAEFVWHNVKTDKMETGFDVTVSVRLSEENSYWDFKITENPQYGIWECQFPKLKDLNFQDNRVILPRQGGSVLKELDAETVDLEYPDLSCTIQLTGMTDGRNTLYLCPEDLNGNFKKYSYSQKDKKLDFSITNRPENMALANTPYVQDYSFNMAVIKGDHYDACKKYRNWGIKNRFTPFAKGRTENRKDLPKWWKDNCVWLCYDAPGKQVMPENYGEGLFFENTKNAIKYLNLPLIVHFYWWSENRFDTHYPNMLPAESFIPEKLKELKSMPGVKIMPYTNGHLTDCKASEYYKQYGDTMLSLQPDGKKYEENWGSDALNCVSCPMSIYADINRKEICETMKQLDFDVAYYDQVCAEKPRMCFNPLHNHPFGGGHLWTDAYRKLLLENDTELEKIKGDYVPVTSESSAEVYPMDGWLRCNEAFPELADEPLTSYIYSGYVMSFGTRYYDEEFENDNALPAINKTAVDLCKGIQLGWNLTNWRTININNKQNEFEAYPTFGKYFKEAAQARMSAKEYFNLGEMVRKVRITSNVPTKKILWLMWGFDRTGDFPLVRTCSFNYKGKTMVCFTSISNDRISISWKSSYSDLNLKNRTSYRLTEIYPKKEAKTLHSLEDTFYINPYETKIFVIE